MAMFDLYRVKFDKPNSEKLPIPDWSGLKDPAGHLPDQAMADAVNDALALGQPLLVSGEAGTGKTLLAASVAYQLGLQKPLRFDTKSTSEARDLFYTYNALARFQAAQTGHGSSNTLDYLEFNALGKAILYATRDPKLEDLRQHCRFDVMDDNPQVVLIDEIDKAPRDFPNDILNEIENLSFRIPELNNIEIRVSPQCRPIVILTSNSEKNLPDAFLRRCVFYHIPFPKPEELEQIIIARLQGIGTQDGFLKDALSLFYFLRKDSLSLAKKPATAELLGWLISLRQRFPDEPNPLGKSNTDVARTLCALLKTSEDQKRGVDLLNRWRTEQKTSTP